MPVTVDTLKWGLTRIAAKMDAASPELNELDAALGDGDLGVTLVRGTRAILDELPALPDDLGQALLKCAQGFTRTSGSTFGTLMATGLMAAAKVTRGRTSVEWREVSGLLDAALTAMAARGKAQLGDKTVLDALDALRRATDGGDDPAGMLQAALAEVAATLDRLRPEQARQGRARVYAASTVGRDDPGMIAMQRIVEGLAEPAASA